MVVPVGGIIDAVMRPDGAWVATGQNKIVRVLVQVFFSTIGAVVYFLAVRPKLIAAARGATSAS